MLSEKQMIPVCRSLAYGIFDTGNSFPIIGEPHYPTMSEKNTIVEFWHCMDRRGLHRDHVQNAIAHTLAWLKWYRRNGHGLSLAEPQWAVEYE